MSGLAAPGCAMVVRRRAALGALRDEELHAFAQGGERMDAAVRVQACRADGTVIRAETSGPTWRANSNDPPAPRSLVALMLATHIG